ncbi:MAG TPA: division/cell wall cluster transcriptional repressor MraZ [Intrasporangiaceae bacterium]|nr:division/cell wall cluster transcriptional repressor MraZ [Intrasporangiaceae bacterium]
MFLGTHTPRLDDKGRLFLPAKFRDRLASGIVVTRGHEKSLVIYPTEAFESLANRVLAMPSTNRRARAYARLLLSGASDQIPDKQGRVSIPAHLREYAGLDRDVTITGAGDHLEVWDSAAWNAFIDTYEDDFSNQEDEVIPGLI